MQCGIVLADTDSARAVQAPQWGRRTGASMQAALLLLTLLQATLEGLNLCFSCFETL